MWIVDLGLHGRWLINTTFIKVCTYMKSTVWNVKLKFCYKETKGLSLLPTSIESHWLPATLIFPRSFALHMFQKLLAIFRLKISQLQFTSIYQEVLFCKKIISIMIQDKDAKQTEESFSKNKHIFLINFIKDLRGKSYFSNDLIIVMICLIFVSKQNIAMARIFYSN